MVRLHFQAVPLDLYAAVSYTLITSAGLLIVGGGNLLGILLVLFTPGYVLAAFVFPGSKEIDWVERLCLSIGLSILVVPLFGLLLNFIPWGISFQPVVILISGFTVVVAFAAHWRRGQLEPSQRLAATVEISLARWRGYGTFDKGLAIFLAASIGVAIGVLASLTLAPEPSERFTEFYALGPSGDATGYPTALNVSEPGTVVLGIANHESMKTSYTVRIDLVGVQLVYNATSGYNETVEINRTTWSSFDVTLANAQNWTQSYTFRINSTGLWKVQFLLFKDGNLYTSYREIHLYVRVI